MVIKHERDEAVNKLVANRLESYDLAKKLRARQEVLNSVAGRRINVVDLRRSISADERADMYSKLVASIASPSAYEAAFRFEISEVLAHNERGGITERVDGVEGRLSAAQHMRYFDLERFNRTVTLPVGNVASLAESENRKMSAYLTMIINRIYSMSWLPTGDVEQLAQSLLLTPGVVSSFAASEAGSPLSDLPTFVDQVQALQDDEALMQALIDFTQGSLVEVENFARERFISSTILQPLYRDVFVSRHEFEWLDAQYIMSMARSYAGWLRTQRVGAMASALRDDIATAIAARSAVSGLAVLQSATILGVKQNAVAAFRDIGHALAGSLDTTGDDRNASPQGYAVAINVINGDLGEIADGIALTSPFGSLIRTVELRDIYGDPVGLREDFEPAFNDSLERDHVIAVALELADLLGVNVMERIDVGFISRNPVWSGLVADGIYADSPNASVINDRAFAARLEFDFMCAVLNREHADTSLNTLFAEANRADLQKVSEDGLFFHALAHKVVVNLLRQYLIAARHSFEWHDSRVWDQLRALNLFDGEMKPLEVKQVVLKEITDVQPVVTVDGATVRSTRYAYAHDYVALTPSVAQYFEQLRSLGMVGDIHLSTEYPRVFKRTGRPTVDAASILQMPHVYRPALDEVASKMTRVSFDDAKRLALSAGRDIDVTLLDPHRNLEVSATPTRECFTMLSEVTPYVRMVMHGVAVIDQLPLRLINSPLSTAESDTENLPTVDDLFEMRESGVNPLVEIDPTLFTAVSSASSEVGSLTVPLRLPVRQIDIVAGIRAWSHDVSLTANNATE